MLLEMLSICCSTHALRWIFRRRNLASLRLWASCLGHVIWHAVGMELCCLVKGLHEEIRRLYRITGDEKEADSLLRRSTSSGA